jgi:hypothetical protein
MPDDNVITDDADGSHGPEGNSVQDGPANARSVREKDDARVRQAVSQETRNRTEKEFI